MKESLCYITVAEFLECEFRFEVAKFLKIKPEQVTEYKRLNPETTKKAARHVLYYVCTNQCRMHMLDKVSVHIVKH